MLILVSETPDKSSQEIRDIPVADLLKLIETDHGFHEVIPMIDHTIELRIFFDIDAKGDTPERILQATLAVLNDEIGGEWAICSCHRDTKVSFHIMSRIYKTTLRDLRILTQRLQGALPWLDTTALWFDFRDPRERGSLRLPNQSKNSINKPAPPFKIERGDLRDFLVTQVSGLALFLKS